MVVQNDAENTMNGIWENGDVLSEIGIKRTLVSSKQKEKRTVRL